MSKWEQINGDIGVNGLFVKDNWDIYALSQGAEPRFKVASSNDRRYFDNPHEAERVTEGKDISLMNLEVSQFEKEAAVALLDLLEEFPSLR